MLRISDHIKEHFSGHHDEFQFKKPLSKYDIAIFNSIDSVPKDIWNSINLNNNIFLQTTYLKALESAPPLGMEFRYAIIYDGNLPVAIVNCQIIKLVANQYGLLEETPEFCPVHRNVLKIFKNIKDKISFRVLVCGNALHGFLYLPTVDVAEVFNGLASALYKIQSEAKHGEEIDGILIKDFYKESHLPLDMLEKSGYYSFPIGPNMIVPIKESWNSFEQYLSEMLPKYRSKVKSAIKKSSQLTREILTLVDIVYYREILHELYLQVHNKSNFRIATQNPRIFEEFKKQMGEMFSIEAYFHEGVMVGFTTRFICGGIVEGDAHGINYEQNKKFEIYQNILFDDVRAGIDNKVKFVNYGRTSEEMKSSLGAVPYDTICFIQAKNHILKKIIPSFLKFVAPKKVHYRNPFGKNEE